MMTVSVFRTLGRRSAAWRELRRMADNTGRGWQDSPHRPSAIGQYVSGTFQRRIALASGRFAMIADGLGFQLVPWTPSIEKHLGKHLSGIARSDGGVDWNFGRNRGIEL